VRQPILYSTHIHGAEFRALHVYFQALSQRQYKQIFQSYRMAAKLSFLVSERVIATALGKVSRGKTDLRKRIALLVNLEFRKHEPDV